MVAHSRDRSAATEFIDDVALLLHAEKLAAVPGAEAAARWEAQAIRKLVELVAAQRGLAEDTDVCLLCEVKTAFKAAGVSKIGPRERCIAMMQQLLYPKPMPKSEDMIHLGKAFLKMVQAGALVEMTVLLKQHPSVLAARSSSKGYSAMHYAAMSDATPVLDWLAQQGLSPSTTSTPADGSTPQTPLQVAEGYKREAAISRLRLLVDGFAFLRAVPATDNDGRLRTACRAGAAAAVAMLLRSEPGLARRPAALAPTGALFAASSGGHVAVLHELIRCGAVNENDRDAPSALQVAVAAQQAEAANLLHVHARTVQPLQVTLDRCRPSHQPTALAPNIFCALQVGHWTRLPSAMLGLPRPPLPPLNAMVVDAKLSRGLSVLVEAYDMQLSSVIGAPAMERCLTRWIERELRLPVWAPTDPSLYKEIDAAVGVAIDLLPFSSQREGAIHLRTSQADALQRLSSLLPYARFPADVTREVRWQLSSMVGEELVASQWARLTPAMHDWVARVLFLLPAMPWGACAGRTIDCAEAGVEGKGAEHMHRHLVAMDLLSKARTMYHLFDQDHEAANNRIHSVLPLQAERPELCPWEPNPELDPTKPCTYSAVLLVLAPITPGYLRLLYPHVLLLNGGGIGGEVREKLGHRIALRLLLCTAAPNTFAPWMIIPPVYSDSLALGCLAKLGGPRQLLLRHPHAIKFTAAGGGEVAFEAADLDEVPHHSTFLQSY
jgi:hypothetical protein